MKWTWRCLICWAFSVVILAFSVSSAETGGRIVSFTRQYSQLQLCFESKEGYSYQVQSNAVPNTRFWADALPVVTGLEDLTTVSVPSETGSGFFRILELNKAAFWYDWKYYQEPALLPAWGFGYTNSTYIHVDRPYEWYIDQADTGDCAAENCGPASAAMSIKWYNPALVQTSQDARRHYRSDGGWWYTSDVIDYLNHSSVPNSTFVFLGTDQLIRNLAVGNLVILCLDAAALPQDKNDEHRVGRFYDYASGHILIVKGYRRVDQLDYFEVYDPNNWHASYDDHTPKGRNRHFRAPELAEAVSRWWPYIIVVPAPNPAGDVTACGLEPWAAVDPTKIVHRSGK